MLIGLVRYILATERLQGPVFTALPGCRATAVPLKREVAPLMAATSVLYESGAFPIPPLPLYGGTLRMPCVIC